MQQLVLCILLFSSLLAGLFSCKPAPSVSKPEAVRQHFFSVAWGCVEFVAGEKLELREYTVESGPCPNSIPILSESSERLLSCPVKVSGSINATYFLYNKRSLDGENIEDLSQLFTVDNFCPVISPKEFF